MWTMVYMARQPRTRAPKAKFQTPSLRDLMSSQELARARQAADLHDRHIQNAVIAAQQRNRASAAPAMGMVPIGSPDDRGRSVRLTSGLSKSERHAEGLEGV